MIPFQKFSKIPRLNRDMIITEKIDGTNAQIAIIHEAELDTYVVGPEAADWVDEWTCIVGEYRILAGSRNRWIRPGEDNFAFAKWVWGNAEELVGLGPGSHYGEWWGQGIQRTYGLKEKRFSLFNVTRWEETPPPACCGIVPIMYQGPFDTEMVKFILGTLCEHGSRAVPGFMDPEGICIFHTAANSMFKVTCKNDEVPKGLVK